MLNEIPNIIICIREQIMTENLGSDDIIDKTSRSEKKNFAEWKGWLSLQSLNYFNRRVSA